MTKSLLKSPAENVVALLTKDKRMSRLERIEAFYLDEGELSDQDEKFRIIYAQIFEWLVKYCGIRKDVIPMIKNHFGFTERYAWSLLRDTTTLHGDVEKNNTDLTRAIYERKYLELFEEAMNSHRQKANPKYIQVAKQCLNDAERMAGSIEENDQEVPELPDFYLTFDERVLEEDTEEIEHEVVDEE